MPGTCRLGTAPLGLPGAGRAGMRSSLGWGWQQRPRASAFGVPAPVLQEGLGWELERSAELRNWGKKILGLFGLVCFVFSSVVKTSSHHCILLFYQ